MRRGAMVLLLASCGRFGFDPDPGDVANPDAPASVRVTIKHNGGDGTVVGPNGFTCTTGDCVLDVDPGTALAFRGLAASGAWFAGWTGPCGGNFECQVSADVDLTIAADFTALPNRVFVTTMTTGPAFGGIAGGDAICAASATTAGLTGTFVAYLSDSTKDAPSRLGTSRGWVRVDGAPFVDTATQFSSGEVIFPARLDELGTDLGEVDMWTGTDFGSRSTDTCTDWTSNDGSVSGAINQAKLGHDLFRGIGRACSGEAHLLCVETGRVVPVAARPDTGLQSFVTANFWVPGGGRASADAHCAAEASLANLSGTFLAAIATTTEPISSRFSPTAIYRRVDGVRTLRAPGLWTTEWLDVPFQLDQFGAILSYDFWTGSNRLDTAAQAIENCSDWTDSAVTSPGVMHLTTNTDLRAAFKTDGCDSAVPLLCLEN